MTARRSTIAPALAAGATATALAGGSLVGAAQRPTEVWFRSADHAIHCVIERNSSDYIAPLGGALCQRYDTDADPDGTFLLVWVEPCEPTHWRSSTTDSARITVADPCVFPAASWEMDDGDRAWGDGILVVYGPGVRRHLMASPVLEVA